MVFSNSLLGLVLLCVLYHPVRWFLRTVFVRSSLSHIPGPLPESWFKGENWILSRHDQGPRSELYLGNLGQLFNTKGLPFHEDMAEMFGGMVKVYGFFGVSGFLFALMTSVEDEQLLG